MTEAEWLACTDPRQLIQNVFVSNLHSFHDFGQLLGLLRPSQVDRRYRLFACNCMREVWHRLGPSGRSAVELAERFVEGDLSFRDLSVVRVRIQESAGLGPVERLAHLLVEVLVPRPTAGGIGVTQRSSHLAAFSSTSESLWLLSTEGPDERRNHKCRLSELFRDIFGNPFRRVAFSPSWRTSTVVSLAAQMYESRKFSAMPILADALQDAGCDSADILDHCRGPGPHVRGCWVVDLVLGKG